MRAIEPMMPSPTVVPRIVAVCNREDGVAKTTTCVNLATGLGAAGLRVLVLDLDPRGDASRALGVAAGACGSYELLVGDCDKAQAAVCSEVYGISVVPATPAGRLATLKPRLAAIGATDLRARLTTVDAPVDVVLIDCPATSGPPSTTAMAVADLILIPVSPTSDGVDGLDATVTSVTELGELYAGGVAVLLTMADDRGPDAVAVADLIRKRYGGFLLPMAIPHVADLNDDQPLLILEPDSPAATAYWRLTVTVLRLLRPFLPAPETVAPVAAVEPVESIAPVAPVAVAKPVAVPPPHPPAPPRKPAAHHHGAGALLAAGLVGLVLGGALAVMAARYTGLNVAALGGPPAASATVTPAPASPAPAVTAAVPVAEPRPATVDPWCRQLDDLER